MWTSSEKAATPRWEKAIGETAPEFGAEGRSIGASWRSLQILAPCCPSAGEAEHRLGAGLELAWSHTEILISSSARFETVSFDARHEHHDDIDASLHHFEDFVWKGTLLNGRTCQVSGLQCPTTLPSLIIDGPFSQTNFPATESQKPIRVPPFPVHHTLLLLLSRRSLKLRGSRPTSATRSAR